ncbi:MAG: RNA-binding protein, partial [Candidatus Heimdallarchaeaceae archaeon]
MSNKNQKNAIYIGKKGTMNYCLVVVTIFNKGEPECTIRARGRAISKAV